MAAAQVALLVSYPLLAHLAAYKGSGLYAALALVVLVTGIFFRQLVAGNIRVVLGVLAWVAAMLLAYVVQWSLQLVKLPALLFPLLLLLVFAGSLLPGKEAIVTAIGENARGPLTPAMRTYTRRITQLWSLIFVLIVASVAGSALYGSDRFWSLLTNVILYPLVGLVFIGEFYLRKLLFPDHDHPGFVEYIKIVTSAGIGRPGKQ